MICSYDECGPMDSGPSQLELFNSFRHLTMRDAISIFHELEGRFKGKKYRYQYKPITEYLGEKYLHMLNRFDIELYRRSRTEDGLKGSAVNREHSVITRLINAFREWKEEKLVGRFNFESLELPASNPGEAVSKIDERAFTRTLVLTPMEFFKFCDYAHPRVRTIVILALLTLLRQQNLEMLNKDNFMDALRQIRLVQSKTKIPLTIPATRTVSIIINGQPYKCVCDFTNFRNLFLRARRESGVYFWMTDIRRTGATQMLLDGIDLRTIQKYLGHTTLVMTERYLQPPAQHMVEAGRKLEERFASALDFVHFSVEEKIP